MKDFKMCDTYQNVRNTHSKKKKKKNPTNIKEYSITLRSRKVGQILPSISDKLTFLGICL